MNFAEILGFAAAVGTTGSFLPQAYKVYKTKKTQDLSLIMFSFFSIGVFLWCLYGIMIHSLPVIISNGLTFILALYILVMKIKHG